MKTKLIYEFEDNEDNSNFYIISNASNFYFCLWDLDQWLRSIIKYPDDNKKKLNSNTLQAIRDKLHELMEEHGVDFEHVS